MGVGGQHHARGKETHCQLYRYLYGWASGPVWTGEENLAPPPGFDPRTVQSVARRYTDWAIQAQPAWLIQTFTTILPAWPYVVGLPNLAILLVALLQRIFILNINLSDTVLVFYRSVLKSHNGTSFYDTSVNLTSFTSTQQSGILPPIVTNLTNIQQQIIQISCTEFQPN